VRRTETAVRRQLDGRQFETQLLRRECAFRRPPNEFKPSGNPRQQPILRQGHHTKQHTEQAPLTPPQHCTKCVYELNHGKKIERVQRVYLAKHPTRIVDFGKKEDYMCVVPCIYNRRSDRRRDCIIVLYTPTRSTRTYMYLYSLAGALRIPFYSLFDNDDGRGDCDFNKGGTNSFHGQRARPSSRDEKPFLLPV
jgi:hypothetical protein